MALADTYKSRIIGIMTGTSPTTVSILTTAPTSNSDLLDFNEHPKAELFLQVFNTMCRRRFFNLILNFDDHNQSIIPKKVFDKFVTLAERFFQNYGNI